MGEAVKNMVMLEAQADMNIFTGLRICNFVILSPISN
jgi:hypothetical protein